MTVGRMNLTADFLLQSSTIRRLINLLVRPALSIEMVMMITVVALVVEGVMVVSYYYV